MTRDPEAMDPDELTQTAAVLMIGGFRRMPIVDGDEVVGTCSRSA